jgi:hypothetical protein
MPKDLDSCRFNTGLWPFFFPHPPRSPSPFFPSLSKKLILNDKKKVLKFCANAKENSCGVFYNFARRQIKTPQK